jgi:hypothetical protein
MSDELRHMTVAVAVVYDKQHGFLLWNNKRWGGYAFPMKHLEPADDLAQAALSAIDDRDFPLSLPKAAASPLECTGAFGRSDAVKEDTYYDYHVFEIDPGRRLEPAELDPDLRFFTYEQLQAAVNVTWSTRVIATSLVEFQEVVVAVICRNCGSGAEFLLVHNRNYGYFFPAVRRKTHSALEEMAVLAVRFDTSYEREITAKYCREVTNIHASTRFGPRQRQYRFYLCKVTCAGVDLCQPGNALQQSLLALQAAKVAAGQTLGERGYWSWFTVEEMKQRPDMSQDVAAVLPAVVECAEKCQQ